MARVSVVGFFPAGGRRFGFWGGLFFPPVPRGGFWCSPPPPRGGGEGGCFVRVGLDPANGARSPFSAAVTGGKTTRNPSARRFHAGALEGSALASRPPVPLLASRGSAWAAGPHISRRGFS